MIFSVSIFTIIVKEHLVDLNPVKRSMCCIEDPNPGSVISTDHADESLSVHKLGLTDGRISAEDVRKHNNENGSGFWAVVDGFVVDATDFLDIHPGGLKKILATDTPGAGATGSDFGFSFSRGRNAHFPNTGRTFKDGVTRFLKGNGEPESVYFSSVGSITILGKLESI